MLNSVFLSLITTDENARTYFDRIDILEAVENDLIKYYKMESILDIMLSEKSIDQKRREVYFVFINKSE